MHRLSCVSDSYKEQLVSYFSPPANQWVQPLLALATGEIKKSSHHHTLKERERERERDRKRERDTDRV